MVDKVKSELAEVKYYFLRKANMEALSIYVGESKSKTLAEKYVSTIIHAPARLYDLFGCLYVQNKTQEAVALEMCYSEEYIRRLIRELINYFAKTLYEGGE